MNEYITEDLARRSICEIGDKMYARNYVSANDGNISVKISDEIIIVTPTGVSKGGMDPDSMVKIKIDGTLLGAGNASSEVKMHLRVYTNNYEVKAVVHAHPPGSTAYAIARVPMDRPIMSESVLTVGEIPVADYALPGTEDVPDSIEPFINTHNAVLLANHGILTWGCSLVQAMFRLETAEQYAEIMSRLKTVGKPVEFNEHEIKDLIALRKKLGINSGGNYNSC